MPNTFNSANLLGTGNLNTKFLKKKKTKPIIVPQEKKTFARIRKKKTKF